MIATGKRLFRTALFVALSWLACAPPASNAVQPGAVGRLVEVQIHSRALEGNFAGDPADQKAAVYLPASYDSSPSRRYPTVYFLHGFSASDQVRSKGEGFRTAMDRLIAAGSVREMIVVVPNGRNSYSGSFYANSSVTGNWEDYVSRDVVAYVDSHYRTFPRAESRGIAGHSMGGFGALVNAMKHPDVFGSVYSLSACCLAMQADFGPTQPAWRRGLRLKSRDLSGEGFWVVATMAMAAAFSPDRERKPFFADLPYKEEDGRLVPDEPAYSRFQSKLPVNMVPGFLTNLSKLRGIYVDVGAQDEFSHIPAGALAFSRELAERGISHIFEEYQGDHNSRILDRIEGRMLPFFSRTLQFEP